jgi:hypothetical protein
MISTKLDSELLGQYTSEGGHGPRLAQVKVAWAERVTDAQELVKQRWPTSALSGELSQELRTPKHFEQAVSVLHGSDIIENFPCGPDPEPHLEAIKAYFDAGYDEVYVTQVGPDQAGFIKFYEREILPYFRGAALAL